MALRQSRPGPDEWEVYALAAGPQPRRIRVARVSLRVFFVESVAVIAGSPRPVTASPEASLRQQHEIVLSLAERIDPLLPARFGSRMTLARLEAAIRPSVGLLMNALDHVRGRRQMTVRLVGPQTPDRPSSMTTSGAAYLAQRRAAFHAVPSEAAPLQAAVRSLVVDERVQPGRGGIRATVFHLVARDDVGRYLAAVDAALPAMAPWRAAVSGPWPPFAFAPELIG